MCPVLVQGCPVLRGVNYLLLHSHSFRIIPDPQYFRDYDEQEGN